MPGLKFTDYFWYMRQRPDRSFIEFDWIDRVIDSPEREEVQADGRIRLWVRISEMGGQVSEGYSAARQSNRTQRIL